MSEYGLRRTTDPSCISTTVWAPPENGGSMGVSSETNRNRFTSGVTGTTSATRTLIDCGLSGIRDPGCASLEYLLDHRNLPRHFRIDVQPLESAEAT